MAGFDDSVQRSYTLPGGGRGESGKIDFSANSFCQAVPTRMISVYDYKTIPAFDNTTAGFQNIYTHNVICDMSISANGTIGFHRQCMRTDLSSSVYYSLSGW